MVDKMTLRKLSNQLVAEPDNYIRSFRKNLFMYIERKDITLAELAEMADISTNTLRSFLYGDATDCYVSNVVKLAKALHVSCDELLGSGTISPQTCESLQLTRMLPESFTHFVRWAIHYHYNLQYTQVVTDKAIEIMSPECKDNGNLRMNNNFDVMDISDLDDEIRPKIFMGIRIPCNHYMPLYAEGDILLIANDRNARTGELVVIGVGENMWILKRKDEVENGEKVVNYYSPRDGRKRVSGHEVSFILGYVVKVVSNMSMGEE